MATEPRWREYKRLCLEHGESRLSNDWYYHYRVLRDRKVVPARRLTREDHFAYWKERLTDREIVEIGNCLDFLSVSPFEPTLMSGVKVA